MTPQLCDYLTRSQNFQAVPNSSQIVQCVLAISAKKYWVGVASPAPPPVPARVKVCSDNRVLRDSEFLSFPISTGVYGIRTLSRLFRLSSSPRFSFVSTSTVLQLLRARANRKGEYAYTMINRNTREIVLPNAKYPQAELQSEKNKLGNSNCKTET